MKKYNGITLIALVITIIVLLILAGVTVSTLTGSNGLLEKTSDAQFKTEIAQYKEELDLSIINDEAGTKGNRTNKFNETEYSEIKKIIPSFNKKYENVLMVEDDKLVYKGKDKELYKKAVDIGLISENELLDDEILEELQPFITEWTVEAGDSITLPLYNHSYTANYYDFTVDYGDGTGEYKVKNYSDDNKTHTYNKSGKYRVSIKGNCPYFGFSKETTSKDRITGIIQWGNVFHHSGNNPAWGYNGAEFTNCINLTGQIPEPSKNSFANFTETYKGMFAGCTALTCNIPKKFFINAPNAVTQYTFSGCKNLTGNIPEDLFKYSKGTSFCRTFSGCKNLTGNIPEKLFINNKNITNITGIFEGCSGLTGSIPEKIFQNCTSVKNLNFAFAGCNGLTGNIPEKLFENCTETESFIDTFSGCSGLTGNIPEKLFKNCPKVTSFFRTFGGCSGLTGNIPEKLFENCTNVNNFNYTFINCKGLTGNAPSLWERTNVTSSKSCFHGCTNLLNYSQIPSDWK